MLSYLQNYKLPKKVINCKVIELGTLYNFAVDNFSVSFITDKISPFAAAATGP